MTLDANSAFLSALSGGGAADNGINEFQKIAASNDYWKMAAAPVAAAKFDTSTWSPGVTAGVTAGQAFLSSVLNAIGQQSESDQLMKVANVLPTLEKSPNSVATPEGVDPQAFGALKINAINSLFRTDEAIRQATGIATEKSKLAAAKPLNRAQATVAEKLGGIMAGVSTLDALKTKVDNLEGGDSIWGGLQRWYDVHLNPESANTGAGEFQRDLPVQVNQITRATGGGSELNTLRGTLESMGVHFAQTKESQKGSIDSAQSEMLRLATGYIDTLAAQGVVPEKVIGQNGETLADLKQMIDAANAARMNGIPASLGTGIAAPTSLKAPASSGPDLSRYTPQQLEYLKSKGLL